MDFNGGTDRAWSVAKYGTTADNDILYVSGWGQGHGRIEGPAVVHPGKLLGFRQVAPKDGRVLLTERGGIASLLALGRRTAPLGAVCGLSLPALFWCAASSIGRATDS